MAKAIKDFKFLLEDSILIPVSNRQHGTIYLCCAIGYQRLLNGQLQIVVHQLIINWMHSGQWFLSKKDLFYEHYFLFIMCRYLIKFYQLRKASVKAEHRS